MATVLAAMAMNSRPSAAGSSRRVVRSNRAIPSRLSTSSTVRDSDDRRDPAAGQVTRALLDSLGFGGRVAVATGDDVLDRVDLDAPAWETGRPLRSRGEIVSANACLGADALLPALGADVVITGRWPMLLHELAHCRAGGKGNTATLSIFPRDDDYPLLVRELTAERVRARLAEQIIDDGRVTTSLAIDTHGKSPSSPLLSIDL